MRIPSHKQVYIELGTSVFIGTLIAVLLDPQSFTSWEGIGRVWPSWLISVLYAFALGYGNTYLDHYLDRIIPWIDQPLKRLVVGILAMFTYSSVVILAILFVFIKIIFEPRCECNVPWSSYLDNMYLPLIITVGMTTFLTSRGFLLDWRQAAIETEQLKRAHIASQYESLKNQINPHFLFNSLNALTNLVYEDQDQAALFIRKLAEVYRYVLDTQDKEVVSLSDELAAVRSFVFLHKIRFEDNLQVDIQISEDENLMLPPLSLQMLVENAIKHNEISTEYPLHIWIVREGEHIAVKNNLQRKNAKEYSSGLGLQNIKSRYGHLSQLTVEIMEDLQSFTVKLPLLKLSVS